jgi:squalene-hopene/tetraprenyl-beta-curcumene cyclase
LEWLVQHSNPDGGWGDTVLSKSNISTTALVWAAFGACAADSIFPEAVARAAAWLEIHAKGRTLVEAITARYGKDHTFSVPILMVLALSGRLGKHGWKQVPALPFELATLPRSFYGAIRLPVVSYALPALIAIGQAIHHHAPNRNPILRTLRSLARQSTLRILEAIQPPNGGFLEATPLTSFVTMALASTGLLHHPVTNRGVQFLLESVREDGSWPIDTNLATWVSTLSIKALSHQPDWPESESQAVLRHWLLGQQYRAYHPYTGAAPGGWAWTNLPGGVPDADDTAGALLALLALGAPDPQTLSQGNAGVSWLLGLQNHDGGIPTFCRGWGALPFDRSSPDITAHVLRAWVRWLPLLETTLRTATLRAIQRAIHFLSRTQAPDGSWSPLWFGNQHGADEQNPTYGTTHVLLALQELVASDFELPPTVFERGVKWLLSAQHTSGGWGGFVGGPPSTEETALAVEAIADLDKEAAHRGSLWLMGHIEDDTWNQAAPIGLYFAKLWYYERLYPLIFTVAALGKVNVSGEASSS